MNPIQGQVEFKYFLNEEPYKYSKDLVHNQNISIKTDLVDLNVFQYYSLFCSFLRAIGFDDYTIIRGAANTVFNEIVSDETLAKLSKEYDFSVDERQYLTDEQRKTISDYLESDEDEIKESYTKREEDIIELAKNIIKEQKQKIKEQEEFLDEWANRYNDAWGKN